MKIFTRSNLILANLILGVTSLVILALFNFWIAQKETIKAEGETVLLALAPVDPRSLIQGDFMRLRFALENDASNAATDEVAHRGYLVVAIDDNNVAQFVRFDDGSDLQKSHRRVRFHKKGARFIRIVPDSFLFQEGHRKPYEAAKFGMFKFNGAQNSVLVGLADETRKLIEPE